MCVRSGDRRMLLFTNDVMVFAVVCVCYCFGFFYTFGWCPKTKHNELILSGRMHVSLLYEMGHGNG